LVGKRARSIFMIVNLPGAVDGSNAVFAVVIARLMMSFPTAVCSLGSIIGLR